jgi:hypothetical protein
MADTVPPVRHARMAGDAESVKEKDTRSSDTSSHRGPFPAENQHVLPTEKDFHGHGTGDGDKIEITEEDCEGELGFHFSETKKWVSDDSLPIMTGKLMLFRPSSPSSSLFKYP